MAAKAYKRYWITDEGYIRRYAPKHPAAHKNYILEHRLIMEEHLGRRLKDDEVIHHKSGDPADNRISNLELMSRSQHSKIHARKFTPRIPKEELKKLYWDKGIGVLKIAELTGVSYPSVRLHMKKFGIRIRTKSEARRLR